MLRLVPPRQKTFPGLLLCAAAMLGLGASACADEQDGLEADQSDDDTQELALEHNASGVRIAQVTANGTGCPRGSWRGSVAPDGSSVSVRFSSFGGESSRRRALVVKDCQLAIKLDSGESLSYALADIRTSGRVYLRDGANLAVTSSAYWQGNPAEAIRSNATFSNRTNRSFSLGEEVPAAARVWSACGKQRDLNISTTARLRSSEDGYGYFEISRIGEVKIAVKRCDGAETPDAGAETPDTGAETPDAGAETPDTGAETPDTGTETPDAGTETPDSGTETPDSGTETPDAAVPPSGLGITGVTANGTGCPAGSATTTISPDGQNFTVAFSQFSGAGSLAIKDCILAIQVANPNAQRYGLEALNLRGAAKLGAGASLTVTSNYYFQGAPTGEGEQSTAIEGPYDQALDITHNWGESAASSSCEATRDLNTVIRARLRNGTADSSFSLSEAGPVTFRLRPCN